MGDFRSAGNYTKLKAGGHQITVATKIWHIQKSLLPTPTAQDYKNSTCPISQKDRDSIPGYLLTNGAANSMPIHPRFYEWLMGFPEGWTIAESE